MIALLLSPVGKWLGCAAVLIALVVEFEVWLVNHDKAVLSGYVALSEKTAAETKSKELERQALAAKQTTEEYRKRAADAEKLKDDANAKLAKRIADDTADDGCTWGDPDDAWLRHH
jgi:hypothetical protein